VLIHDVKDFAFLLLKFATQFPYNNSLIIKFINAGYTATHKAINFQFEDNSLMHKNGAFLTFSNNQSSVFISSSQRTQYKWGYFRPHSFLFRYSGIKVLSMSSVEVD